MAGLGTSPLTIFRLYTSKTHLSYAEFHEDSKYEIRFEIGAVAEKLHTFYFL